MGTVVWLKREDNRHGNEGITDGDRSRGLVANKLRGNGSGQSGVGRRGGVGWSWEMSSV